MRSNRRQFLIGCAGAGLVAAATNAPPAQDLFEARVGDYALYRIPGVVVTRRGTVLVYAEARRNTGSDWDDIDLVVRRSTDGGRTFGPVWTLPRVDGIERNPVANERKQGKPEWRTYNNPVMIAAADGTVHFLFCAEYMRVFYCMSRDDGRTFSKPVEITAALEPLRGTYPWRVVATGPGHGIELRNKRLLVPVWIALGTIGNGHGPSCNTTIYSDDRGKTWHCGGIAVPDSPEFPSPNETALIEHADGRVTMNVRTASARNWRSIATSPDGSSSWSTAQVDQSLTDPICAAGLVRIPGRKLWAFSNPDSVARADGKDQASKDRKNLTLRLSEDEGRSWRKVKVIEPGASAYSDPAALNGKSVLCFYEARNQANHAVLRLERLDLTQLAGKRSS